MVALALSSAPLESHWITAAVVVAMVCRLILGGGDEQVGRGAGGGPFFSLTMWLRPLLQALVQGAPLAA